MIIWGTMMGALFGTLAAGIFGVVPGALLGALAGHWLQKLVRREVAAAIAQQGVLRAAEPLPVQAAPALPIEAAPEVSERPRLSWPAPPQPQESAPTPVSVLTEAEEQWHGSFAAREHAWLTSARNWLLGGNTIVRTGLVILFLGLTFLASYAASHGYFPIELRLSLVGAAGALLVGVGFSKREQKPMFARALEGTGVAVLYLTIFASARLYELIPLLPAFGLMILFSALGCALAIMQNSQPMALAAFVGGFAVPVLLGGNSQQPFVPFSYYTLLNLAILGIAWRRPWRLLNLVGFFATFGMAWVWGLQNYQPVLYGLCQAFLAGSVLIYLATAVFYAHNTPGRLGNVVDAVLLFGPALAGFSLQVGLVRPYEFGSAYSSLAFGAIYIALAAAIVWRGKATLRPLVDYLIAIGVGFVTLAIPLALTVHWTAAGWAVEGAVALWIGSRQNRWGPRLFGLLLEAVGAITFLGALEPIVSRWPFANGGFVGAILIAIPLIATAWWLRKPMAETSSSIGEAYRSFESLMERPFFLAGFGFLCLAFILEIGRELPAAVANVSPVPVFSASLQRLLGLIAVLVAMWASAQRGQHSGWRIAQWPGRLAVLALWFVFMLESNHGNHVLYAPNWLLWIVALVLNADLLFVSDNAVDRNGPEAVRRLMNGMHVGTVWLVAAMVADSLRLGIDRAALWNTSWSGVIFLVSGTAVLAAITWWAGTPPSINAGRIVRWPLKYHAKTYCWAAAAPIAVLVYSGALATALLASGDSRPLPYVPLLNPVDLSVAMAFVVLLLWRKAILRAAPYLNTNFLLEQGNVVTGLTVLGFAEMNGIWLRTVHHWLGVEWSGPALDQSFVVQAGLSILWTGLAMALMIFAYRRLYRPLWIGGAALLAAVVAKLILVDLSNIGGWERIVSYTFVGALMLVIGYFAPLPPRARDEGKLESAA